MVENDAIHSLSHVEDFLCLFNEIASARLKRVEVHLLVCTSITKYQVHLLVIIITIFYDSGL